MGVKMNLRIVTENHAADPEIGFLTKSISKPYGRATAMPPAWELRLKNVLEYQNGSKFVREPNRSFSTILRKTRGQKESRIP